LRSLDGRRLSERFRSVGIARPSIFNLF